MTDGGKSDACGQGAQWTTDTDKKDGTFYANLMLNGKQVGTCATGPNIPNNGNWPDNKPTQCDDPAGYKVSGPNIIISCQTSEC
jgi:hypothetical protein